MLVEFEKKYDIDFREGWDGGTFYIGTKGVMHSGCYGQRPRLQDAQPEYPGGESLSKARTPQRLGRVVKKGTLPKR